jgi:hypothetical protein
VAAIFGIIGICWDLATAGVVRAPHTNTIMFGATLTDLGRGLGASLICLLVGSAIGALCNPPVITRPAASMLASTAAVVLGLVWSVSPANAAVRSGYGSTAGGWPAGLPVIAAIALLVVAWGVSALVAARRTG